MKLYFIYKDYICLELSDVEIFEYNHAEKYVRLGRKKHNYDVEVFLFDELVIGN